jgi:hypothetical protein
MAKNDKINIRIEVYKDKNSGKLSIRTHFDSNAPNVVMDSDGYIWMPTFEEKEFINEAFQLIPMETFTPNKEKLEKAEENLGTKPIVHFPKIEKQKEPSVFKQTESDLTDEHSEKDVFEKKENINNKKFEKEQDELSSNEKEIRKKEERVIVEADNAAIDAALKRRMDDDKSFVEVDEQTILDRVLSQKKKGKWSK